MPPQPGILLIPQPPVWSSGKQKKKPPRDVFKLKVCPKLQLTEAHWVKWGKQCVKMQDLNNLTER